MPVRKPAEARKAEIVETALRLAHELGPDRLSTGSIAEAVGLTQPAIFRHFPTKQDLWQAAAAHIGAMMEARWNRALDPELPATARIRALIAAQLRLVRSTPAIPAILFSRELHSRNEGLRAAFFGLMERFHRQLAALVTEARDRGELRPDVDPDDAAFLVIGLVQGLAVRWSISNRGFDLAEEGARLLDLQLSGLVAARGGAAGERIVS